MNRFRDDAPPWSFFIPVTLAVIVGVLASDAIRYAARTVMSAGETARVSERPGARTAPAPAGAVDAAPAAEPGPDGRTAAADEPAAEPATGVEPEPLPPGPAREARAAADREAAASAQAGLQELPGPVSARRDGDPVACINNTVVNRSGNGWEQSLENDAPVRCTATSP